MFHLCVWIELIFAEIENWNWKHCSEISFKCVNSTVEPIFNKKIIEKCNLWDSKQYTDALFIADKVNYCGWTQKKKKKRKTQLQNAAPKCRHRNNFHRNGHLFTGLIWFSWLLSHSSLWTNKKGWETKILSLSSRKWITNLCCFPKNSHQRVQVPNRTSFCDSIEVSW